MNTILCFTCSICLIKVKSVSVGKSYGFFKTPFKFEPKTNIVACSRSTLFIFRLLFAPVNCLEIV